MRRNIILILIVAGIIIGDVLLFKVYNRIEDARQSVIKEGYANEQELYRELQYMDSTIEDIYLAVTTRS